MELFDALLSSRAAADVAATVLLKGTVLLGLSWLVTCLLRRRSSAERHAVWTVAFAAALLVPVAGGFLPTRTVHLLDYPKDLISTELGVPEVVPLGVTEGGAAERPEVAGAQEADPAQVASASPAPRESTILPGVLLRRPTTWWGRAQAPLAVGFLLVWLSGALVFAVRLASHWVRVWTLTLRGCTAFGDRPDRVARAEASRQGIRRPVRVVYSAALPVPATWGTLRPTLILPAEAPEWHDGRLRAVMVHEVSHIRRWDFLAQQLSELARVIYWPNPLLWLAFRTAAGERERACDDEVLRSGLRSVDYARLLVEMARRYAGLTPGHRPGLDGGLALARPCSLRERVTGILDRTRSRNRAHAGVAMAASLVVAAVAIPLASLSVLSAAPGTGDVPELIASLDHPDAAVRLRAVRTLGRWCDPEAVDALVRTLTTDPDPRLRLNAAFALGETGSFLGLGALKAALDDPSLIVQRMALEALGEIDHRMSADALLPYLASEDRGVRWLAINSLGKMRLQSGWLQPRFVRVLAEDPAADNRALAAVILGRTGCDDVVDVLKAARDDTSPAVRTQVEQSLSRLVVRGVGSA